MKKTLISHSFILLSFYPMLASCGGEQKTERSPASEAPVNADSLMESTEPVELPTTMCCSNHTPSHCAVTGELEGLSSKFGCIGFH